MKYSSDEYIKIIEQRKKIKKELKLLEQDRNVKRYIELKKLLNYSLSNEQYDLCNHLFVHSKVYYIGPDKQKVKRCGCIKCGLDESVLDRTKEELSTNEKIMYDYLKNNHNMIHGIRTNNNCDLNLARAIYSKIKDNNPNINDLTAIKYFEIALDNIRNIDVSEERKKNRAKRLALKPNFNKWDANDICINK